MSVFLTSISSLIAAIFSALLSVYMLQKGISNKVRFSFALLLVSVTVWLSFYTIWLWQDDTQLALQLVRIVMVGAIFTYPTLLHFVVRFSSVRENIARPTIIAGYVSAVIFSFFSLFTDKFLAGVTNKLAYINWPIRGGVIFDLYVLVWVLICVFSLIVLYLKYKKSSTLIQRAQTKLVFIGLLLGLFGGATNFFLWYDISIPPYGNWLIPLYLGIIAYAIVRYRFADIKVVIKRSLIFTILVLLITSIFSVSAFVFSNYIQIVIGRNSILVSGIITGIIVAIGFEPIKKGLTKATDRVLFKDQYDPAIALSESASKLASILELKKLGEVIYSTAYKVLKFKKFKSYVYDEDTESFRVVFKDGPGGYQDLKKDNLIYEYYETYEKDLDEKSIIVTDELEYRMSQIDDPFLDKLVAYLTKHGLQVVAPLYIKNTCLGFLLFGDKKSGDPYSNEDLNFIRVMAGQAAVAFENARLYEEQRNFAIKLQEEVDKATKELRSANKELKKLDQAKSEFISIASHQLRTPMTVIKGYLSMMKQGDFGEVSENLDKPVNTVMKSTDRLLLLIEDLLNISRIESGRMKYEFEKTNLQNIVESVYEELQNHAKQKGLELIYHPPKERVPDIIMDKQKVREVVMNLADNAIKYTDKGKVELFLEKQGNELKYSVKDTGRGISKDDIGKLFKKFSRAGSAELVHTEGTGLGLYIARQIIKRHSGKIWAESQGENEGSTFALTLKIKNPKLKEAYEEQQKEEEESRKKREEAEVKADTIDVEQIKVAQKKRKNE